MRCTLILCILLTFLLLHLTQHVYCGNILIVMPLPSRSHFKSFQPLFEELIRRNHNVTLISGHSLCKNVGETYTHIDVSSEFHNLKIVFAELRKQNRLQNLLFCTEAVHDYNEYILRLPKIQKIIKAENITFDLIITELFLMDVYLAFGYHFNAPVIGLSAQSLLSYYDSLTEGYMTTSSYVPNLYLPMTNMMSFKERMINFLFNLASGLYYNLVCIPKYEKQIETYFNFKNTGNIPKMRDLLSNISLIFVNSHFSIGYPKPYPPNVIETAGIHIEPPKELSPSFKKFMDDSAHEVIYFSLGSLINPHDIKEFGETVIKIMGKLSQRVIFKWKPQLLSFIPDNVLVQEWIPQMEVLNHPKCQLFITHGGLHSILESVKLAVPILGIPFYTDQQHNMIMIENFELGKKINFENTETDLLTTIHEVLQNPKYRKNVEYRSRLFSDRPSAINTAVYWVEYVLYHRDVSFMKSPVVNLQWYQYLLVDVVVTLILVTLLIIFLTFYVAKIIIKICKGLIHVNKSNKEKTS